MESKKAYAPFQVKSVSEDSDWVHIEGIASTPQVDRVGDIVEPMGMLTDTPTVKLLLNHDHKAPVGEVYDLKPTKRGIAFKARLPKVKEEGAVKTRVDEAIHSLKYGLINAFSIGFSAKEYEPMSKGGLRFLKWLLHELSMVPIPANPGAILTAIKSYDVGASAPQSVAIPPVSRKAHSVKFSPRKPK